MAGRPCNPGSDLHGLWRLLLPGTAFPACGAAENSGAEARLPAPAADRRDERARAAMQQSRDEAP